jgi:hypothetical protein
VVIGHENKIKAEQVRLTLLKMQKEHRIDLVHAVVVVRDEHGRVRLHQLYNITAAGAVSGGFWAALIGLLFLSLPFGMAIGAATAVACPGLALPRRPLAELDASRPLEIVDEPGAVAAQVVQPLEPAIHFPPARLPAQNGVIQAGDECGVVYRHYRPIGRWVEAVARVKRRGEPPLPEAVEQTGLGGLWR